LADGISYKIIANGVVLDMGTGWDQYDMCCSECSFLFDGFCGLEYASRFLGRGQHSSSESDVDFSGLRLGIASRRTERGIDRFDTV
jgi:hypothetical protein